mmetsp:Transcript_25678/g.57582  ORF Transcript_25678/g.57582 Transcript_25678/m.57582 type:complete len:247 (-) Transcript_25678:28-768(-)
MVDEKPRAGGRHLARELAEGRHAQAGPEHEEHRGALHVDHSALGEFPREALAEEGDVGLDQPFAAARALWDPIRLDLGLNPHGGLLFLALDAASPRERPVRLHEQIGRNPGLPFERVDVLGEAAPEYALGLEEFEEQVRPSRRKLARPHFLGECAEGLGPLLEVVDGEDGLGPRQFVFGKVVVQARARSAEVWYARAHADAGAGHDHDPRLALELEGLDLRRHRTGGHLEIQRSPLLGLGESRRGR